MEDESREREGGRGNEGQNQRSRRKEQCLLIVDLVYKAKSTEVSGMTTCNELESFILKFRKEQLPTNLLSTVTIILQ